MPRSKYQARSSLSAKKLAIGFLLVGGGLVLELGGLGLRWIVRGGSRGARAKQAGLGDAQELLNVAIEQLLAGLGRRGEGRDGVECREAADHEDRHVRDVG